MKLRNYFKMSLFAAIFIVLFATAGLALTETEIMKATNIVNLEAQPLWFKANQPIDFIVTVKYDGGTQDGFDVGVFHEGRLIGWEMNKRFNNGMNTFKLHDSNFKGEPGSYIVKIRYKGKVFTNKNFASRKQPITTFIFTIDPKATPPRM